MRSELRDWNPTFAGRTRERIKGGIQIAGGIGEALIVVPFTVLNEFIGPRGYESPGRVIKGRAVEAARRVRNGFVRVITGQAP